MFLASIHATGSSWGSCRRSLRVLPAPRRTWRRPRRRRRN